MPGVDDSNGGARRRRSASYDDDELTTTAPGTNVPPTYAIEDQRATEDVPASRTSAIGNTTRPTASRLSSDVSQRVRFSTDIERHAPPPRTSSARNRASIDAVAQIGKDSATKGRPGTPNLIVNTEEVTSDQDASGPSATQASPMPPRPSGNSSPLSPKSRNRGLSLRSALFHRNYSDQARPSATGIELEENVGGSQAGTGSSIVYGNKEAVKSRDTVVSVVPAQAEYASEASDLSKAKLGKGPIALPQYSNWAKGETLSLIHI